MGPKIESKLGNLCFYGYRDRERRVEEIAEMLVARCKDAPLLKCG